LSSTSLSESTVNFHLRHAMHKLKCNSKHVAAYRAAILGLIRP
jgi:DNA-binding CsgD family transcriptional regulator